MKVEISVTQTDIDAGEPYNPYGCPVALAVTRAFKGMFSSVAPSNITVYCSESDRAVHQRIRPPQFVKEWIKLFDGDRKRAKPFTFVIETED